MNHRYYKPFMYVMVALGGAVLLFSLVNLSPQHLGWPFLCLAAITLTIASTLSIMACNSAHNRHRSLSRPLGELKGIRGISSDLTGRPRRPLVQFSGAQ